jgi:hypothetical protein
MSDDIFNSALDAFAQQVELGETTYQTRFMDETSKAAGAASKSVAHSRQEVARLITHPSRSKALAHAGGWVERHFFSLQQGGAKLAGKWTAVALGAVLIGTGVYKFLHRHKENSADPQR